MEHWQHLKHGLSVLDEDHSPYLLAYLALTIGCLSGLLWGRWGWFAVGLVLLTVGGLVAYTVGRFDPGRDDDAGHSGDNGVG